MTKCDGCGKNELCTKRNELNLCAECSSLLMLDWCRKRLGRIPLPKKKLEEQKGVILAWNDDPDDFEYNGKKYKLSINHKCSIERDIISPMNHIIKGFDFPTYQTFKSGFKQSNLGGFF